VSSCHCPRLAASHGCHQYGWHTTCVELPRLAAALNGAPGTYCHGATLLLLLLGGSHAAAAAAARDKTFPKWAFISCCTLPAAKQQFNCQ